MKLEGTSLIGFGRARSKGPIFYGVNPATGEALEPPFHSATPADVDRAAQLAAEAFTHYGRTSGKRKGGFLRRIADRLESRAEPIVTRANLETALPAGRLQSELGRTCGQLRMFAELVEEGSWVHARIDHADPQRRPIPKPDVRAMLRPLGPVAVFGSSNFPLAFSVAGGDTASALAAGCPVVFKAHPAHPGTSEMVGSLVQAVVRDADLPEGVLSMLFDAGYDVGLSLIMNPAIKAAGFTGSRRGGLAIVEAAARRAEPIPVYAEMSSINPIFILPEAMRLRSAELASGLNASVTLGVGQFCTNPGLVFIENCEATQPFLQDLQKHMGATQASPMLTASICGAYRSGVERFSRIQGVQQLAGGTSAASAGQATAALFRTAADTFLSNADLMEEVFGPCTLVVECTGPEQLLAAARALEGQLTATVHGTEAELENHRDLLAILETKAGRLICNGFPTGVEVCHAMVHGGPFPATSDGRSTSVGTWAIQRFVRPVCFQNMPDSALPEEIKESNPIGIRRLVDGQQQS